MEGVPSTIARLVPTGTSRTVPGLALCAAGAALAFVVHHWVPSVSTLLVAIMLGLLARLALPLGERIEPGAGVAAKRLLRAGIVLLGAQLALGEIVALGAGTIAVVVSVVVVGITGTLVLGRRLGVPLGQRMLIACGFSICGAAAVAAADGVVDAEEEDVASAIALVVVFGTLMIPVIPLLAGLLGLSEATGGRWAGASIHEVAQVVAAGGAIGGTALAVAVVVKLARVLMLAPVLAALSWRLRREGPVDGDRPPRVPLFVLGFFAVVLIRSTGQVPGPALEVIEVAQTALLATAMFALGLGVRVGRMARLGFRPLLLAALSTLLVGSVGLAGALLVA